MLMVSISSTSTNATDHEAAFSLISFARASREFASSFFRVVDTGDARAGLQDKPRQRRRAPQAGLIPASSTARNGIVPLIPQKRFKTQHLAKPLPFRNGSQSGAFSIEARIARRLPPLGLSARRIFFEARLQRPTLNNIALT